MTLPTARPSPGVTWVLALASALWMAIATRSLLAWAAVAFVSLVPVVMTMVTAQAPAKSVAEIIRDAETGRSL
jgi:hypothetical protein